MKYKLTKLSNGLPVLIVPMANLASATITVWTRAGSRNETEKNSGISHFLEHMAFKGGKKYPSAKAVSTAIDAIGGEFNAGTSKEWTNYYIRTQKETLETAFDLLSDILLSPQLRNDDIKREKGVIVEEIAMYEDTPMRRVADIFEHVIFSGHGLGRDIAGTKETVRKIKKNDFVSYRKRHYIAENILITVSGGVSEKEIIKLAEKYFGKLANGKRGKDNKFSSDQTEPKFKVQSKKIEQGHFMVGFLGTPMGGKDRYVKAVLNSILGSGMSSRLFTEVREKRGLAYAVRSGVDSVSDTGYLAVYAGTDPKKTKEALKIILDQCYGMANNKFPIADKELAKAKGYLKGHLALSLEDTRAINYFFGLEQLILGKIVTPREVFEGIEKVTKKDVITLAKEFFQKEKLNFAMIAPIKNATPFEKIINN